MSRPSSAMHTIRALTAMELRLALRRGENVLVTIVIPAVVLLFFGGTDVIPRADRPVGFLVPGSLALAIIATSLVNLGIATAYDRHYGVLKRLGGAPVTRWQVIVAKLVAVLLIEFAQVVLLIAIAAGLLGWRLPPGAPLGHAIAAFLLGTAAFAGLGLAMAGTLRAEATLALANALFIAFLILGGVVLPLDHLPAPLATIASYLPAAPLSELYRAGLGEGADGARALMILAAWAIGAVVAAAATFRWE
jgi:ABC-2 type transport system permease protein